MERANDAQAADQPDYPSATQFGPSASRTPAGGYLMRWPYPS